MTLSSFRRRMVPMYAAKFLRNFVFWYAVEKLFMTSIGFGSESIALMVALYSAMSILMEIPSGILADRWSRKGVLILATVSLGASSLVGGLSYDVPVYLLSAILWGFFDALASGTDEAMVYDALLEEKGNADDFEKEYGIYNAFGGIALFAAGLVGGLIGNSIGLRETYLLTVPLVLLAIPLVLRYRDATIHKHAAETALLTHIRDTFSVVFRNPNLIWILVTMFSIGLANGLVGEMHQLWYIALSAPVLFFGVVGAVVNATWGFGGIISRFFVTKRAIVAAIVATFVASLFLIVAKQYVLVLIAHFVIMILANGLSVAMVAQMHRHLPSRVRAGASSAVNTVARFINIPLVLLFGWVAGQYSVFTAAWIVVTLVGIGLASELNVRAKRNSVQ